MSIPLPAGKSHLQRPIQNSMVILGISFQLLFHSVNPAISQEIPKGATQASAKLTTQQSPAMDKQVARQYRGSERCDQCHFNPSPRVFTDFVMLTEARQFLERDKHSQAAQLLNGPRAKQIGMLLKLPNVAEDQQCLSCHANWKKGNERPPEWKKGVNCEACHGPSAEWDVPHSAREWRLQTPEAKTQLGLVDVRNSARRAEQCFACHIGSVAEGKVITHAMYAAGHPPLPGIEIESFAEQMPAHWRTLAEKGSFEHRDSYLKVNAPHDPSGKDLPRTKQMIVGGLVALRESLELVADQTRQEPNEWPELAAFDCQACHHELRSPSWRQERHPLSAPGRPTLPEWPFALVNTGLRQIAGPDEKLKQTLVGEFRKHRAALYASIQKQPFGEPMSTRDAIEKFLDWLKPTISKLEATQFDLPAATRARLELLTLEDSEFPDFHSARQIVWACGVIGQELELRKHPLALAEIPLKESDTARRNRENSNTGLLLEWREKTLKPMRQKWAGEWSAENAPFQLPLLLPTGPGKPDSEDVPQELIVNGLSQSLEAVSNYDALKFRARLKQMRETLLSE